MQFPALANKWWEWKAAKAETLALRTKYGKWMGKAKASNQRPLYAAEPALTRVLLDFMEEEIISVESDSHFCRATSITGKVLEFWSANRMYAYANEGNLKDKDGKELLSWDDEMPDYWVCFMLVEKLENHISTHKDFLSRMEA